MRFKKECFAVKNITEAVISTEWVDRPAVHGFGMSGMFYLFFPEVKERGRAAAPAARERSVYEAPGHLTGR